MEQTTPRLTQASRPTRPALSLSWQKQFWLPLLFILALAAFLRLYNLAQYPQAFNQDEAILGYDSLSLWTTGKDHHGNFLPVHFRTFNDSVPPLANYLTAPFVGLLGLSEFSTRLPFALLGVATVGLVGLLGRRWFGAGAGLGAAFLLTVEPWHLNYSRTAYPASLVPFFITLSLYTFTRAISSLKAQEGEPTASNSVSNTNRLLRWYSIGWLAASAASFAALTYAYTPMKLQAPLLLGTCLLAAFPALWRHRWLMLGWLSLYLLLLTPLLVSQILYWAQIQLHYSQLTVLDDPDWPVLLIRQYGEHYNAGTLFVGGYRGGTSVRPPGIGELFWLEGFLWVAAAVGLSRQGQTIKQRLALSLPVMLGLWFLTFPFASSLTDFRVPHEIRAYNFLPLPELLAGYGLTVLWKAWGRRRWRGLTLAHGAALAGGGVFILFGLMFLPFYFRPPLLETTTAPADIPYNLGLRPMLEKASTEAGPCDQIWLEDTNQTYAYYLFMTAYPSARFQANPPAESQDKDGWILISHFDQLHFGVPGRDRQESALPPSCAGQPSRLLFLSHTTNTGPEWTELAAIRNAGGAAVWRLLVKAG